MDYPVPQIQHETKIGGLTFSQLIFVGGGVALASILYFIIPQYSHIVFPIIALVTLGLAFGSVHGMSIPTFVGKTISYFFIGHTYIWKSKRYEIFSQQNKLPTEKKDTAMPELPKSSITRRQSKISDLNKMI
ncbi:MAG: hypothetical protein WC449_04405 [Candidatus Paceibacterota bacterium]